MIDQDADTIAGDDNLKRKDQQRPAGAIGTKLLSIRH